MFGNIPEIEKIMKQILGKAVRSMLRLDTKILTGQIGIPSNNLNA